MITKDLQERDPLQKWLPILSDLKPKMQDALSAGVSLSNIRESLENAGLKVPQDVLKKFIGFNNHPLKWVE